MDGVITSVSRSAKHTFSKPAEGSIRLLRGLGVEGDAHLGEKIKHRSRVAIDPNQPNLRQVHLIHAELLDELSLAGFNVSPGEMGENITTRGIDLLGLPLGARLHLGESAVVEVTGLRNPCVQLDRFQNGLQKAVMREGVTQAGVMSVVIFDGDIQPGDPIRIELPAGEHKRLGKV